MMNFKKSQGKKGEIFKSVKSLIPKIPKKVDINPFLIVESTKNKIGNYYKELKKKREKERIRLETKKKNY